MTGLEARDAKLVLRVRRFDSSTWQEHVIPAVGWLEHVRGITSRMFAPKATRLFIEPGSERVLRRGEVWSHRERLAEFELVAGREVRLQVKMEVVDGD